MPGSDKQHLRRELLAARRARSAEAIEQARAAVAAAVLNRCAAAGWRCVAGYLPLRTEPGSPALLAGLAAGDVRVLVPVLLPDRDLDWVQWPRDAVPGEVDTMRPPGDRLGVAAIGEADAVLVPALAVSDSGTRLGRGGGSYDRALARVRPGVPIVALLYPDERRRAVPSDPWDVAVTAVVTPEGWHELR